MVLSQNICGAVILTIYNSRVFFLVHFINVLTDENLYIRIESSTLLNF